MTNHETLLRLQYMYDTNNSFMVGRRKEIEMAMKAIKELEKYQEIGTVEELKVLKEKEERFDRNIKMFNEIGLEIRAKAIDEFAERAKHLMGCEDVSTFGVGRVIADIDEIAEQMKGEQNERLQ